MTLQPMETARPWPQDARRALAEARAAPAEVLADLLNPEPGNPWRLDSVKTASALLTGGPLDFDSRAPMVRRAMAGTLAGRFKAPDLGPDLEPLARAARNLAEAEARLRGARQAFDRAEAGAYPGPVLGALSGSLAGALAEADRARLAHAEALAQARAAGFLARYQGGQE